MIQKNDSRFQDIVDKAHEAGMEAGIKAVPRPMVVAEHANMADDGSQIVKAWLVPEGVCGMAWIIVKDARTSFCRWLKKKGIGTTSGYYGGVMVWASAFGQSYERKRAYAAAYAAVLQENGIKCYSSSRLD